MGDRIKGITVEIGGDVTGLNKALASTNKQISGTQSQLKDVERLLKLDPTNTSLLAQRQRLLGEAVEETSTKLSALKEAEAQVQQQFSEGKASQEQYEALQREIAATESQLKGLSTQAKTGGTALSKISDGAGKASKALSGAAETAKGFSAAAAGIATAAIGAVKGTEELRTDLSKLENNARTVGVSINATREAFNQFNIVSDEADSSVEATSNLLQAGFTESNLQKAVEGLAGAYLSFPDTLKIESLADSLQETLATGNATGQFAEFLDRVGVGAENFSGWLSACTSEAEKHNLALSILYSSGMMDVYNGWVDNNEELVKNKEANAEMQQSLAELGDAIQPLVTDGMQALADVLQKVAGFFDGLSDGAKKTIGVIVMIVATVAPVLMILSSVFGAISSISNGLGALGKVGELFTAGAGKSMYLTFAKWALIIIAVVAAVAALIAMINVLTGKGSQVESAFHSMGGAMGGGSMNIPQYATGTSYHPGGLALVGEEGPELLNLPRGAQVYTNGETGAMLGGRQEIVLRILPPSSGAYRDMKFQLDRAGDLQGISLVE